ncbi:thioredoxin-like [Vulpes lagopus]|uniref:thioredoxin-like n=1 Tax=Vulpes lagopus TaxID=494514 RepID=UPI001BCA1B7E|nr:thioredoxin-like [Vulpes lagopus]
MPPKIRADDEKAEPGMSPYHTDFSNGSDGTWPALCITSNQSGARHSYALNEVSATWCGPCKMIKPFFHSLSEKYSNVVFLEVDVDDCQDVASECEVKCMPTFQFFKKGQKVGEFSGANKEKLEATINELI